MLVKIVTRDLAHIFRFVDAQQDAADKRIEALEQVARHDLLAIPRTNRALHALQDRVLADPLLQTAQHQSVVHLLPWPLNPMREPLDEPRKVTVAAKHPAHEIEPQRGLSRVSQLDRRRPVQVEARHVLALDPSAFGYQPVGNGHRHAGCPRHLLDRPVIVEPEAGGDRYRLAIIIGPDHDRPDARVDAARRPHLARRCVKVRVHWHEGIEVRQ